MSFFSTENRDDMATTEIARSVGDQMGRQPVGVERLPVLGVPEGPSQPGRRAAGDNEGSVPGRSVKIFWMASHEFTMADKEAILCPDDLDNAWESNLLNRRG